MLQGLRCGKGEKIGLVVVVVVVGLVMVLDEASVLGYEVFGYRGLGRNGLR